MQNKRKQYTKSEKIAISNAQIKGTKSYLFSNLELKSDDGDFYIEGIASSVNKDLGNDVVTEECLHQMADMINSKNVKIGFDHTELLGGRPSLEAVGRLIEAKVKDGKLWVKGILDKTFSHFNEIKDKIQNKFLDGLSIEYQVDPSKVELKEEDEGIATRIINGLKTLIGVALTPRPMNQDALFDYFVKHMDLPASTSYAGDNSIDKIEVKQMPEEKEEAKEAEEKKEDVPEAKKEEEKKEEPKEEVKVEAKSIDFDKIGREAVAKEQEKEKIAEIKRVATEAFKAELKNVKEPYINPEAKFGQDVSPFDPELKKWRDTMKDPSVDIEVKYQAAAKLHDALHPFGITDRHSGTLKMKKAGKSFETGGKATQDIEIKNFEYKAQLEHDTDKISDTDYYQNAAELNDVYDPVIVSHLNDKTTLWGLMKKKNVSSIGSDRYGFRVWRTRIEGAGGDTSTYYYDEGATLTGYHAKMLPCQIPFMQYGVTVQVSGLMVAEARGSVGDIFAKQVSRASADLLRGINSDLFGTGVGMTAGGAIMGLEVIGDDGGTYANVYGHARGTYSTLQGTDDAQSGTPNPGKTLLRKAIRTVEKNGANRSQLIFVCDHIQKDKILGLLDPAQRFQNTTARAGFEGLPTFDGIPIHSDDQCNDGYVYLLPMDSYYAAVLTAPTYEDLAKTDDSKKGFIKSYFAVVCENPNWVYKITGLSST